MICHLKWVFVFKFLKDYMISYEYKTFGLHTRLILNQGCTKINGDEYRKILQSNAYICLRVQ